LESQEYKDLVASREAAHAKPDRLPRHEENEWHIELVGEEHQETQSPSEYEPALETVADMELGVADMIAKLEAAQR
jgi:hypothetical protein